MVLVVYYKHDYGWNLETKELVELVRYGLRKLEKLETLYDLREMISL
ncbi:MAG: hypothetical protein PUF66_04875 [Clostridium sp.]|nr:hypothetical protein [Clostridium sp.]